MNWTQVSPTRWERPLTGMEEYFVYIGNHSASLFNGRQQYTLISRVKVDLNIPDVESALRHAWKQVRYEEPDVAITLEADKKVYEVLDDAGVERWADETFIIDRERDSEQLYAIHRTSKPSTLYYLPKSSELVLHGHHATWDGIGLILFWDRFFRAVTNPNRDITFGGEHVRLAPGLDDLLGSGTPVTPEKIQKGTDYLMKYVANLPGIGPPSKSGKAPPGECHALEYVFNEDTTAAIIKGCKARGISVTTAVHAAYITVINKYADPDRKAVRYTSPSEFDVRKRLQPPYNKAAAGNYYIFVGFSAPLPASFPELTAALNTYYRTTMTSDPAIFEVQGLMTRGLAKIVQSPGYHQRPPPSDALVSSLGVVENHLQRSYGENNEVVVEDWKLSCDCIQGMTGLHVYTFREKLRLVYQFNEAYQDPKDIRMYLEEMEKVLRAEIVGSASA
ncbi:hypothetical protein BJX64DRAFT_166073 [Aspergillus heterothallicus]